MVCFLHELAVAIGTSLNFFVSIALEERMKALERKHEILTDAYDYETGQLQTAIERLFGYHIILVREPHSQIRLQSVHSPNPDNMFIFQVNRSQSQIHNCSIDYLCKLAHTYLFFLHS